MSKTFSIKKINSCVDIAEVLAEAARQTGERVFFDDSRAWSVFYYVPGGKAGAFRNYLGGGVRGAICGACRTKAESEFFVAVLKRIEVLYNEGAEDAEVWDKPSGVLTKDGGRISAY